MQLAISGTSEGIFKLLELHSSHDHTAKASKNHTLTRTGSSTKQLQDFSNYFHGDSIFQYVADIARCIFIRKKIIPLFDLKVACQHPMTTAA